MEAAIKLNIYDKPQNPRPSIRSNNTVSTALNRNVIERSIVVNNTSRHITFNKTIECNKVNSYIEGKVIDMKAQLEINRILKIQKNIYLSFFIISILGVITSWVPGIFKEDVSFVLKPLSVAFSLMIALHYHFGRAK